MPLARHSVLTRLLASSRGLGLAGVQSLPGFALGHFNFRVYHLPRVHPDPAPEGAKALGSGGSFLFRDLSRFLQGRRREA